MTKEKLASQTGHAFCNALLKADYETLIKYQGDEGIGTKVVLYADNQQDLEELYCEAQYQSYPSYLVIDSGHIHPPDFDGSPTISALGVGPLTREQAQFLSHLKTK